MRPRIPAPIRRWIERRRLDQRALLADDARRLAGYAEATVTTARRLGAEVEDGVDACTRVWRHWAGRLAEWAHPDEQ